MLHILVTVVAAKPAPKKAAKDSGDQKTGYFPKTLSTNRFNLLVDIVKNELFQKPVLWYSSCER